MSDLVVETCDASRHRSELGQEGLDEKTGRLDDGWVGGQRSLGLDGADAAINERSAPNAVSVEEVDDGLSSGALHVGQGRPALKERSEDFGLLVAKPVQNLREVSLQGECEAVSDPHAILDEVASRLDEAPERAHVRTLVAQRLELIAVASEDLEGNGGVRRVVFGSTGSERPAVLRQRAGVDWVDHEDVVFKQCRNDRAVGKLEAHCDALAGEALAKFVGPVLDGLRSVLND
jgi:hypothetical protein